MWLPFYFCRCLELLLSSIIYLRYSVHFQRLLAKWSQYCVNCLHVKKYTRKISAGMLFGSKLSSADVVLQLTPLKILVLASVSERIMNEFFLLSCFTFEEPKSKQIIRLKIKSINNIHWENALCGSLDHDVELRIAISKKHFPPPPHHKKIANFSIQLQLMYISLFHTFDWYVEAYPVV